MATTHQLENFSPNADKPSPSASNLDFHSVMTADAVNKPEKSADGSSNSIAKPAAEAREPGAAERIKPASTNPASGHGLHELTLTDSKKTEGSHDKTANHAAEPGKSGSGHISHESHATAVHKHSESSSSKHSSAEHHATAHAHEGAAPKATGHAEAAHKAASHEAAPKAAGHATTGDGKAAAEEHKAKAAEATQKASEHTGLAKAAIEAPVASKH